MFCVLLRSLQKNETFSAFFYVLCKRTLHSLRSFTLLRKECKRMHCFFGSKRVAKKSKKENKRRLHSLKERKRPMHSERKRKRCPTLPMPDSWSAETIDKQEEDKKRRSYLLLFCHLKGVCLKIFHLQVFS